MYEFIKKYSNNLKLTDEDPFTNNTIKSYITKIDIFLQKSCFLS